MTCVRNGVPAVMTRRLLSLCIVQLLLTGCSQSPPEDLQTGSAEAAPPRAGESQVAESTSDLPLPPITPSGTPAEAFPAKAFAALAPIDPEVEAAFEKLLGGTLDVDAWEQTQQSIIDAGPGAASLLARELESPDVARREQASSIVVLLGSGAEAAVPALQKAVSDSSAFVRANAAAALAQFPDHRDVAKQALVKLLDAEEPELRRLAAMNLSLLGSQAEDLVPRLTLALDDKDTEVVRPIAQLLGEIGPPAKPALEKLQQIAFEQEGEVKEAATQAVQKIEGQPSNPTP